MKQVVEAYIGIWILMVIMYICLAFTMINLHTTQARKIYNDIKAEISACNGDLEAYKNEHNGAILDENKNKLTYASMVDNACLYTVTISKDAREYQAANETYIYNDLCKIDLEYNYSVPIFGKQIYPLIGYAY